MNVFRYKRLEIALSQSYSSEEFIQHTPQDLGKKGWELVTVQIYSGMEVWYFKMEVIE